MKKKPAPALTAERATELAQLSELRLAHFQELTGVQPGEIGPYIVSADGVVPNGGLGPLLSFPCDPRRLIAFAHGPLSQLVTLPTEYEVAVRGRAEYCAAWDASILEERLAEVIREKDRLHKPERGVEDRLQGQQNASGVIVVAQERQDNLFLAIKRAFEVGVSRDVSTQALMDYLLNRDDTGYVIGAGDHDELKWRDTKGNTQIADKNALANRLSRYRRRGLI